MTNLRPFGITVLALLLAGACGSSAPLVHDASTTGTGGATGAGGATVAGDGGYDGPTLGVDGAGKIPIGQAACSDGMDNDGDGKTDYDDPECVGPLDDDEGSFATGIPGDNIDACKQDCFFDGNSGMGDDGCQWQLQCDPANSGATAEKKCPYDPDYVMKHMDLCAVSTSQGQACVDFCQKLTPNGCDCFGCCAVPGAATPIRLAPTCTADKFNDPTACPPCTQVTSCNNVCERCELCIGKTTLPPDCYGSDAGVTDGAVPPPPYCQGTIVSCGPGGQVLPANCPAGTGCVTGCCIPFIP